MKKLITLNELRKIIKKKLNEIKQSEFSDFKSSSNASSHALYTGSRNNKKFYIKSFSFYIFIILKRPF